MTLGTNFLGPFALTNLLFPTVRSQIIDVASDAHESAKLGLDDPHLRTRLIGRSSANHRGPGVS